MSQYYGKETAEKYRRERKRVTNVGTIFGGIKPFTQLLKVFVDEIHRKKDVLQFWGIDNAMINYLRYSGAFKGINVTVNTYSQRLAFEWRGGFDYNEKTKSITNSIDGCSPIIRHKMWGNEKFLLP